jgi:hypothetical protein
MPKRQAIVSPSSERCTRPRITDNQSGYKTPHTTPSAFATPAAAPSTSTATLVTESTPVFKPRYEGTLNESSNTSMHVTPEKTELVQHTPLAAEKLAHIEIEIIKKDNLTIEGTFPRDILKKIWIDTGRKLEEINHLSSHKNSGRSLQVFYFLKEPLSILDVTSRLYTETEVKIGSKTHGLSIRFPQFRQVTSELGKLTSVTVHKVPPGIDFQDLRNWLSIFGTVQGSFRSVLSPTLLFDCVLFTLMNHFSVPKLC